MSGLSCWQPFVKGGSCDHLAEKVAALPIVIVLLAILVARSPVQASGFPTRNGPRTTS